MPESFKYIGNFGDVSYDLYGGFFVLYDKVTGYYRAIATENLYDAGVSENREATSLEWVEMSRDEIDDMWNESFGEKIPEDIPEHDKYAFKLRDIYYYYGFYQITGEQPERFRTFRELRKALRELGVPRKEL